MPCSGRRLVRFAVMVLSVAGTLCGCMSAEDAARVSGVEDVVILEAGMVLSSRPSKIDVAPRLRADGDVRLCLVLASGVDGELSEKMDALYVKLLREARPVAILSGSDRHEYRFSRSDQTWTKYGRVSGGGELSACLSPDETLPKDDLLFNSVVLLADAPLSVMGVYWSTRPAS